MKRLYNLILACLLMVSLSACGKQAGTDSSTDQVMEQQGQTESAGTTEQTEQEQPAVSEAEQTEVQTENILTDREEQKIEGGDNTVTGDISFNFETKTHIRAWNIQPDRGYLCRIRHGSIKQRCPPD